MKDKDVKYLMEVKIKKGFYNGRTGQVRIRIDGLFYIFGNEYLIMLNTYDSVWLKSSKFEEVKRK